MRLGHAPRSLSLPAGSVLKGPHLAGLKKHTIVVGVFDSFWGSVCVMFFLGGRVGVDDMLRHVECKKGNVGETG